MDNADINDPLFRQAVEAIDAGNITVLEKVLTDHPRLVKEKLTVPKDGYFKEPYLLWFIADNPIRYDKLPANIVDITKLIIQFVKREAADSLPFQLDYTLGLVATGRIPKECGVQIELIDTLIDAGAKPGTGIGALAHGNPDAVTHLIKRGGELSLAVAVCLDLNNEIEKLLELSNNKDKHLALVAAAFYGKKEMLEFLIQKAVDVNGYPDRNSGFHSHATALHQAVFSGSLDCVKLLIDAGADLSAKDKIYNGTPLGWAQYMQQEVNYSEAKKEYKVIEEFLLTLSGK